MRDLRSRGHPLAAPVNSGHGVSSSFYRVNGGLQGRLPNCASAVHAPRASEYICCSRATAGSHWPWRLQQPDRLPHTRSILIRWPSLYAPGPVLRLSSGIRHSDYKHCLVGCSIDNAEGETFHQHPPRPLGPLGAVFGIRDGPAYCFGYRLLEPHTQAILDGPVVADLVKQLLAGLREEAERPHRAIRRASARTSSPSIDCVSPRSWASNRRSTS